MMMMYIYVSAAVFVIVISNMMIYAEQYSFDLSQKYPSMRTSRTNLQPRVLQTNAEENCFTVGSKFECEYTFDAGISGNETTIIFQVQCDMNTQAPFDYRRSNNCGCNSYITPRNSPPKYCPCSICAEGFGDTPVSVDCTVHEENFTIAMMEMTSLQQDDNETESGTAVLSAEEPSNITNPYLFSTCTSIDCTGACNGTCSLSCDSSGDACPACENYNGNGSPTSAPIGSGSNDILNLGEETSAASISIISMMKSGTMLLLTLLL